ncbi:MAG: SusC/RagA family TonB-linked outer membrane protein [Gemmatimonadetes bacterium]|nr:SusC/RagA family TonB-linked outer membrane protein [Gemmatimonadota bacterium]
MQYRLIGLAPEERTVGAEDVINVQMKKVATQLDAVVVSALGQTAVQRSLGTSQQSVDGGAIASTQRENFINALQGRVAGVEVTSSSGVPGASSSITIRGVSSISSSNQPLMIVDGLPIDNKTTNTGVLASDAPGSAFAFSNRGLDFTNRAADINPNDIESLVVLKGPEASALYGIDAANGAIVITTKRGRAGSGGLEYSASFRVERPGDEPEVQRTYGPTTIAGGLLGSFFYFGAPYPAGTTLYDNVDGFFRTAMTQKHNLAFSGAAQDNRINYRVAFSGDKVEGVVPNSNERRGTLTGASQAQVTDWLRADLSMTYSVQENAQPYKGANGPLLGLLSWPATDDAKDWLTPAGTRRRLTSLSEAGEIDNPYFNVAKNQSTSGNNRIIANLGLIVTPFSWGSLKSNIGLDGFTNDLRVLRHPESALGNSNNGILDEANDVTRNINAQTLFNINRRTLWRDLDVSAFIGNQISAFTSTTSAINGRDFLDPNFVSANNTNLRTNRTTLAERRLVSAFGQATFSWKDFLYLNVTGRNDWTSTIPVQRNSFFYPSVSTSFVFSDAFPAIGEFMTGKLRAAYAEVGKDARPYAYRPSLEFKTTSFGGYGYGFTGPNLDLKPEFARSYEFGTELSWFDNRLGLDVTWYRKRTRDQIVNDIRGSYATGFILFNLNGAVTENKGWEVSLRGTPVQKGALSWDILGNFERARGKVVALPNALPESYVSDTWLYGNVRNGTTPGLSTRSMTGLFYLRNQNCDLLIDPTTGLPLRSTLFISGACGDQDAYDRQPDWTLGVTNSINYRRATLSFLLDFRRGGDVFNATEHFLTSRGLSLRTLDREQPRVIKGVLRDGKENGATPTANNIVIIPAVTPLFYTGISEELFIERDINWIRLRDVTLRYLLPGRYLKAKDVSAFVTGTDLLLITNYSGLDPIVNGNSAAVGGSGGAGIDYGNFPMPRRLSLGFSVRY